MNFKVVSGVDSFPPIINFETIVKLNASNDEVQTRRRSRRESSDVLKLWIAGESKHRFDNVTGEIRIGGFGIVSDDESLPKLYGPLKENLTDDATKSMAEIRAALFGLQFAKKNGYEKIEIRSGSKFLENIKRKIKKYRKKGKELNNCSEGILVLESAKILCKMQSEMFVNVNWVWTQSDTSKETAEAIRLAELACFSAINNFPGREAEVEATLYRNDTRRTRMTRMMQMRKYPNELPPTLLRSAETVLFEPQAKNKILCSLEITPDVKDKLIREEKIINKMTSSFAFGSITALRTCDPLNANLAPNVMVSCHSGTDNKDTLLLQEGCVVGVAYSGNFSSPDDQTDTSGMAGLFWHGMDGEEKQGATLINDWVTEMKNLSISNNRDELKSSESRDGDASGSEKETSNVETKNYPPSGKRKRKICWSCHAAVCGTGGLPPPRCLGCMKARYCDPECQAADWERHQEWCSNQQASREVESESRNEVD